MNADRGTSHTPASPVLATIRPTLAQLRANFAIELAKRGGTIDPTLTPTGRVLETREERGA